MPDTGFNTYLTVAPDGTVVVPNNIDPAGVITAGDLVSHTELDDALAAAVSDLAPYEYVDASVTVENLTDAGMAPEVDVVGNVVVRGGASRIAGPYSFDLDQAAGSLATFYVDYDFGTDGPPGAWPDWAITGYLFPFAGSFAFQGAQFLSGNTVRFIFICTSPAPDTCQGTFTFYVPGNP